MTDNYFFAQPQGYGPTAQRSYSQPMNNFPSYNFSTGSFYSPSLRYNMSKKDSLDFLWRITYSTELKRSDDKYR